MRATLTAVMILFWLTSLALAQVPSTSGSDEFYVTSITPMGPDTYDVKLKNPRTGYVHSVTIIEVSLTIAVGDLVRQVRQGGRVVLVPTRGRSPSPAPKPNPSPSPPRSEPAQGVCNLKALAGLVFARYGTRKPIAISRLADRPNTYLVLLSGTEFALEQTTHIVDDIAAFQGNPALSSAYVSNVLAALRSAVPPGAHLIIVGHSLGGMVAQNLVTNHEFVRQYKADRVITFGSPQTTPEAASTQYVRAEAIGDPVPRLGPLQFQWHRSITVAGPAADPIGIHNSYNKLQELAGYDMAGHFLPDPSRSEAIDLPTRQTFRQECFRLAPGSLREFASPYVQGKSHTAR